MADFKCRFDRHSGMGRLYQALKKAGVKDAELDEGVFETDPITKKRTLVGKGDRVLQPEEVLNYALERYDRFQLVIRDALGYAVSWSFDDLDSNTTFDREIREKIGKAVAFFKSELERAGHKSREARFQELLALSLYAFALAKEFGSDGRGPKIPSYIQEELEAAGLRRVADYIVKTSGGLDLMSVDPKSHCPTQATALQAWKGKCGACSEHSSILYALFKMAGLKTSFIHGQFNRDLKVNPQEALGVLHESTALILPGNRMRIFDSGIHNTDAAPAYKRRLSWWYQDTPREVLGYHYYSLGMDALHRGMEGRALEELTRAGEIHALDATLYLNIAILHGKRRNHAKAAEYYERALKLRPNDADALCQLGYAYTRTGDTERAIQAFKRSIAVNPRDAEVHLHLGAACASAGRFDEAIDAYKQALAREPKNVSALSLLGIAFMKKMDFEKAAETLRKAVAIDPKNLDARFNLSVALYNAAALLLRQGVKQDALKKLREAQEETQKVLKLQGDHKKARELLDNIDAGIGKIR